MNTATYLHIDEQASFHAIHGPIYVGLRIDSADSHAYLFFPSLDAVRRFLMAADAMLPLAHQVWPPEVDDDVD